MTTRKIMIGTMAIFVGIANATSVRADQSIQKQAMADAQTIILEQKQVDENYLRQQDPEYIKAFLATFEEQTNCFTSAYYQGIEDARRGGTHIYESSVAQLGYRQGIEQGQRLLEEKPELPQENKQEQAPALDDHQSYRLKVPTVDQARFINRLAKAAQEIGRQYDLFPSVIIAQAALESNWGTSDLGRAPYFNLFGVKGYFAGNTVNKKTSEYTATGEKYQINSNFRQYTSDYEALKDYAQVLTNPLYVAVHRQYAKNYRAATRALVGKYATDPHYHQKLNQLIESYQLTKYDDLPDKTSQNTSPSFSPMKQMVTGPNHDHSPSNMHQKEQAKSPLPHYIPLVGGIGSAGLLEVIRRFILK